jgi:hypothetical protein
LLDILLNHPPENSHPSLAAHILSQVISNDVEEVSLSFKVDSFDGITFFQSFDWDATAKSLLLPQFANLRKIILHLWAYSDPEPISQKILQGRFSVFDSRGILHIQIHRLQAPRNETR